MVTRTHDHRVPPTRREPLPGSPPQPATDRESGSPASLPPNRRSRGDRSTAGESHSAAGWC
jgi:hypothetical protein